MGGKAGGPAAGVARRSHTHRCNLETARGTVTLAAVCSWSPFVLSQRQVFQGWHVGERERSFGGEEMRDSRTTAAAGLSPLSLRAMRCRSPAPPLLLPLRR